MSAALTTRTDFSANNTNDRLKFHENIHLPNDMSTVEAAAAGATPALNPSSVMVDGESGGTVL